MRSHQGGRPQNVSKFRHRMSRIQIIFPKLKSQEEEIEKQCIHDWDRQEMVEFLKNKPSLHFYLGITGVGLASLVKEFDAGIVKKQPPVGCVTKDKLLNCSECQFPHP